MIKILHTADIHLGAKFSGLGGKGPIQREQLRVTFRKVVSTAIDEGANIILIAGDLFDSNHQSQMNIDLVIEQFNLLGSANIPVCIIPGTHDCFDSSSIYRKVDFEVKCPNVKVFAGSDVCYKEYPDLDLTVYGRPNLSNRSSVSPLKGLSPLTPSRFQIAMAHGSLHIPERIAADDHVFTLQDIEASGMDYVALGHWHRTYGLSEKPPAWYSGPPEWIPGQTDKGGVLLVSLSDTGEVSVEPRLVGLRQYEEVSIDMSELRDMAMLQVRICEGANQNLVRQVTLRGLRDTELMVNVEQLQKELGQRFFHLDVIDRSHAKSEHVADDGERLIRSRFIGLMHEQIQALTDEEKDVAETALQYGVALLDGKLDVREDL